jgi:hypothetical protein
MSLHIIRSGFHFVEGGECVQCWLGEPYDPESEFIFEVHKDYVKDIIAGLKNFNSERDGN